MKGLEPITGFDGYFIDKDGNIYTSKKANKNGNINGEIRPLALGRNSNGYLYANIYSAPGKKNRHSVRVHKLVWQEFKGCVPEGFYIDHKNAIKHDNRLENLQLLTPQQTSLKYHRVDKLKAKTI
jgi:hypothetical protein